MSGAGGGRDRMLERVADGSASVGRRYRTIVADPPWPYDGFATSTVAGQRKPRGAAVRLPLPYASMTIDELRGLPVRELADPSGCALWLWATSRYLPDALELVSAWGFRYRQALVWRKTGCPSPFGGTVAPTAHAEYLLVAALGRPSWTGRLPSSVLEAPAQRQHSRKPDAILDAIETVSAAPRVELFARRQRLGWDTWGNEALGHVELGA